MSLHSSRLRRKRSKGLSRRPVPNGDTVKISVVICTRDRPDDQERCLASFWSRSRSPEQILETDNASKDERTMFVSRRAGADYVREERSGIDVTRNTGAWTATGDIVAYTDDDVVLHRHWLERLVVAFDSEHWLRLGEWVEKEQLSARELITRLEREYQVRIEPTTLRTELDRLGYVWKRTRYSLKKRPGALRAGSGQDR